MTKKSNLMVLIVSLVLGLAFTGIGFQTGRILFLVFGLLILMIAIARAIFGALTKQRAV